MRRPKLIAPVSLRLKDADAERIRRNHEDRIAQLQTLPVNQSYVVKGVELEDATSTPIPHPFGRRASVFVSPPYGGSTTGRIQEIRSATYDPRKYVVLEANGWGATVTVDVWVM